MSTLYVERNGVVARSLSSEGYRLTRLV